MSDDGLLGRVELEPFSALGDRLVRRGVVADLFIVGGAAMALAYDADRVTRDVDAIFLPHGIVLEEAHRVEAMGLPPQWLNDQASAYVFNQYNEGKRAVIRGIAERMVFRNYPTLLDLLLATAAWIEATVFAREESHSIFDLPFREAMQRYDARPELAHVVAETAMRGVRGAAPSPGRA